MLKQEFVIPKYNWVVQVYYYVTKFNTDEILNKLESIGCSDDTLDEAYRDLTKSNLNTGFAYSNMAKKKTVMVIANTSSPAQFMNSYDHERKHLISHIEIKFGIDPHGEESAYLCGIIGQLMFPIAKNFMCECCRK